MQSLVRAFVVLIVALLFTQCRTVECTVVMADVDVNDWSDEITISHINSDTTANYDLSVMLHVNRDFKAQQLDVEIITMTPDSLRYTEHVLLPINTEWSSHTIPTTDIAIPYRQNVHLRCVGEYKVTIAPQQSVVGVEAAGINFQPQKIADSGKRKR